MARCIGCRTSGCPSEFRALSVNIESPKVPYLSDLEHGLVRKPHTLFGNMLYSAIINSPLQAPTVSHSLSFENHCGARP